MNLIVLLVLVGIGAVSVTGTNTREVTATVGKSVSLEFDYNGPTSYVRYNFLKDKRYFRADRRRIFQRLGRIFFSKVTEADSGVYQMIVRGSRVYYNQAIVLKGGLRIVFTCILYFFILLLFCMYFTCILYCASCILCMYFIIYSLTLC